MTPIVKSSGALKGIISLGAPFNISAATSSSPGYSLFFFDPGVQTRIVFI
jgi:hypothetical protein